MWRTGEEDADYGVDQIEVVGFRRVEVVRQEILYPVYQHLQYQGGECREDTYQKAEYQDELLLFDVLLAPQQELLKQVFLLFFHLYLS